MTAVTICSDFGAQFGIATIFLKVIFVYWIFNQLCWRALLVILAVFQFILLGIFKWSFHLQIMVIYHLYSTYSLYFFFLSYCTDLKISNLIASEIVRNEDINARVSTIEKWVAVADICRCLHNYNAVLEITSSMNRSAIFRLKKTWLKVSKQVPAGS